MKRLRLALFLMASIAATGCTQTSDSGVSALEDVAMTASTQDAVAPNVAGAADTPSTATAFSTALPSSGTGNPKPAMSGDPAGAANAMIAMQKEAIEQQRKLIEDQRRRQLELIEASRRKNETTLALAARPGQLPSVGKPANPANATRGSAVRSRSQTGSAPSRQRPATVQEASVGTMSRSAGDIVLNAPWKCVPDRLKSVIAEVSRRYGTVTVNSTHRSRSHNRRVRGARNSYHLRCQAVDFRVKGDGRAVYRFLRAHPHVGGLKRYRSGYFHIDTGPRRTWRG